MSSDKFRRCHEVTAKWEGGWSDHAADPGGKTMYGVTEAVYHAWLRGRGEAVRPVRNITRDEAERIYHDEYWRPCGGPTLRDGVDLAAYDASVNSGVSRGRRWLIAAIGGPDDETVKRLCARRLSFMRGLGIWDTFGRGWARRVADIEAKGVAWALAASGHGSGQVRERLEKEAGEAGKSARRQEKSGGGSAGAGGAGGAVAVDQAMGWLDWLLLGLAVAALIAGVVLIVRSRINREREKAYAREAKRASEGAG